MNIRKLLSALILITAGLILLNSCSKNADGTVTVIPISSASLPIISTIAATDLTSTSAQSGGTITLDGGVAVTARGVCWATSANPTTANSKTTDGTGIGTFTSTLTGLTAATSYYVRSYATNSVGTVYGSQVSFTTSTSQSYDVYVVGSQNNSIGISVATVWKNGVANTLSNTASDANSVYVVGNDVYIAGFTNGNNYQYGIATVWKNGVATLLTKSENLATANSVFISGSDVYVAGWIKSSLYSQSDAVVWKNGVATILEKDAESIDIFIEGSNVFVHGFGNSSGPVIWKNGIKTNSPADFSNSFFVVGSDIYVAGGDKSFNAVVFKNGTATVLGKGNGNSVFVSGSDVYVAGQEQDYMGNSIAKYWKNGVSNDLITGVGTAVNGKKYCRADDIFVVGNDVFVAGFEDGPAAKAVVWKNGISTILTSSSNEGIARSIFVKAK